jgi:hypothetical protein
VNQGKISVRRPLRGGQDIISHRASWCNLANDMFHQPGLLGAFQIDQNTGEVLADGFCDALALGELEGSEPGLSSAQIGPQAVWRVEVAKGGSYVRLRAPPGSPQVGGGVRQPIYEFSSRSRRQLLDLVNKVDRSKLAMGDVVFVTLTYPKEFPTARSTKRHLRAFLKRLRRAWGQFPIVWKLEPQKRGAPHFHLLTIWQGVDLGKLQQWTSQNWYEVCATGDEKHLAAGTRVELARGWDEVAAYAGKYLGKLCIGTCAGTWHEPGRFWGVVNRDLLPISLEESEMGRAAAVKARRWIAAWHDHQVVNWYEWRYQLEGVNQTCEGFGEFAAWRRCSAEEAEALIVHRCILVKDKKGRMRLKPLGAPVEVRKGRRRRRRLGQGGLAMYMPCEVARRILDKAMKDVGMMGPPGDPVHGAGGPRRSYGLEIEGSDG